MATFIQDLPIYLLLILIGLASFIISFLMIPQVSLIVKKKNLMEVPNNRSSHIDITPTMGGIAFVPAICFSILLLDFFDTDKVSMSIAFGVMIMLFVGIKDDLFGVSPKIKILFQTLAVTFIFFVSSDIRITTFDNFLFASEIPFWVAYLFAVFTTIVIVNSYNLIDGINGLAAMVGSVIFMSFSYIFYKSSDYFYSGLCIACIGSLIGFLRYNISRKKDKNIFMGDTGSMIMGFLISIFTLRFLSLNSQELLDANVQPNLKFFVLISVLIILFLDTTRVFIIRTLKSGNPFKADRNHIHHIILDYIFYSHIKTSLFLSFLNLVIFIIVLYLNTRLNQYEIFFALILIIVFLTISLFYFNKSFSARRIKSKIKNRL